jgi:hypothetical protein
MADKSVHIRIDVDTDAMQRKLDATTVWMHYRGAPIDRDRALAIARRITARPDITSDEWLNLDALTEAFALTYEEKWTHGRR